MSCSDDTECFTGESCNAGICTPVEEDPTPDTGDDATDSDLDAGDTNLADQDAADADVDANTPDEDASADQDAADADVELDAGPIDPPELPEDPFGRDECSQHNLCGGCDPLNVNGTPGAHNTDNGQSLVCTDFAELTWLSTTPDSLEFRLSWDHPALVGNPMGARAAIILCREDATGFGDTERCLFTRLGAQLREDAFASVHVDIDRTAPLEHQLNLRYPPSERLHVGVAFVESRDNLRAIRAELTADVYVHSDNAPLIFYPRFYEHGWLGRPGDIWYAGVIDWGQELPNAKYTARSATYDHDRRCRTSVHQRCGSSARFFNASSVNIWNFEP